MSQAVSGTYHQVPVGGRTGTGKRWSDAGLLFVQQFYFPASEEKDYTTRACIGRQVSKARLAEYEKDVEELSRQEMQLDDLLRRLKEARDFECLKDEPSHYVKLSRAGGTCKSKQKEDGTGRNHPFAARGAYKELEEKEQSLQKQVKMVGGA